MTIEQAYNIIIDNMHLLSKQQLDNLNFLTWCEDMEAYSKDRQYAEQEMATGRMSAYEKFDCTDDRIII